MTHWKRMMDDDKTRMEALYAKREAGQPITPQEVIEAQTIKLRELKALLREETARAERAEAALRDALGRLDAEGRMRPSLEVLQRMANGLDPYDHGRFQCAVAALPHETPKLSATIAAFGTMGNIGDRLDRARQQKIEASGLRVVESPADPAA